MEIDLKFRIRLGFIILLIIIGLTIAIYLNGRNLSCDQCSINFRQTYQSGIKLNEPILINATMIELFEGLNMGKCIIEWGDTNGYYDLRKRV